MASVDVYQFRLSLRSCTRDADPVSADTTQDYLVRELSGTKVYATKVPPKGAVVTGVRRGPR